LGRRGLIAAFDQRFALGSGRGGFIGLAEALLITDKVVSNCKKE
jgi:hypothetical protein